jgi:hypothetical protein
LRSANAILAALRLVPRRAARAAAEPRRASSAQVSRALPGVGACGAVSAVLRCGATRPARAGGRAPLRVLALVNVDFGPGTLLGLLLIGSGVALYQASPARAAAQPCAPHARP